MVEKAKERILAAADPIAAELVRLATKSKNDGVRRQACSDLLDRCGLKAPDKHEVTGEAGKPITYRIVLVEPDKSRWQDDPLPQPLEQPANKPVN